MRTRLFCQLAVIVVALLFSASVVWAPPRFYDYGNGTVIDFFTMLVWLKNANCTDTVGGVSNASGLLDLTDAAKWSSGLATGVCGLSDVSQAGDWRVPTIDELKSLICGPGVPVWQYISCDGSNTYNPNGGVDPFLWLNSQGFMNVQPYCYLSSSAPPGDPNNIFGVCMAFGFVFTENKSNPYYVWPVRLDNYVRVDGTPDYFYHSLQDAFDNILGDSVVRTRGVTFTENLSLNRVVDLKLFGGYSADYSSHDGVTTINGDLTIDKGSLVVDRVVIR